VLGSNGSIVNEIGSHNHDPYNGCHVEVILKQDLLVDELANNIGLDKMYHHRKLYNELLLKYNKSILDEYWIDFGAFRNRVKYLKKKNTNNPVIPKNLNELRIPDSFGKINDKDFLRYDNLDDKNRIIIFMSDDGAKMLAECKTAHFDGTFKTAPKLFNQILTIHANIEGNYIPCAYVILKNKNRDSYFEAIITIKSIIQNNFYYKINLEVKFYKI
jgi:hypothetical protein